MIWTMEAEPPFDRREILRYMRADAAADDALQECIDRCRGLMKRQVLYDVYPVEIVGDQADLGFAKVRSRDLARALSGCSHAVLFAATAGFAFDRLIAWAQMVSPLRGLMFHAIGAERAEALCDAFCAYVQMQAAKHGLKTRPRFSPGYGDLPLGMQADIQRALHLEKIGISLDGHMLMRPSKSVTALIGLCPDSAKESGVNGVV